MVVPCLFLWLTGKAGRIRVADITLLLYCLWCALSLMVNHGFEGSIQPAGVQFVETAGAYFVARCYIRDADNFLDAIRLLFLIVVILFPLAVLETVTNRNFLLESLSPILPVHPIIANEMRWGLRRVQAALEHPILFGVVCGSIMALVHLVLGYGEKVSRRWLRTGIVGATAFLSLSAGPITALAAQGLLLFWNWMLRKYEYRWRLLGGMLSAMWIFLSLVANRSVPNIFLSYFSFDAQSAYFRILIWTFGTQSALNHPFFGVGLNRWDRPSWMPSSIDMFWLIHAVHYGIPAAILMFLTFLLPLLRIGLLNNLNERLEQYRTGYMIAMCGFFLAGWTVHFWNATYVLFLFLLGGGLWMLDGGPAGSRPIDAPPRAASRSSSRTDGRNGAQVGGRDRTVPERGPLRGLRSKRMVTGVVEERH
ncbi:O-antigen ligase domain-containing protein [Pararhizobium sp. BT-229]|uniref:O-antigen ligase family protein n=1 Tax=Pararhizobium sp. BT-229 TaxID=2986923 RepID=UPI0021F76617|nr:O-antigen ligase domain-containing protein [Pararhizobium sp. BT-229]MCV9967047.1 O-antigen ligase domain-containing protein [Pararhizobium sp. BT-229]